MGSYDVFFGVKMVNRDRFTVMIYCKLVIGDKEHIPSTAHIEMDNIATVYRIHHLSKRR